MANRFDLDNSIKQELTQKAEEAMPSDGMLPRIKHRIETYEGGKDNMLKNRMPNIMIKKLVIVSLCTVLMLGGIMFTFSEDVRVAAMDVIRTIFILDKTEDGYVLVEKTDKDEIFTTGVTQTSYLSDEELTEKMGFKVSLPKKLQGGYKLHGKGDGVALSKPVNYEASRQLSPEVEKAINDEAAFNSLSEYKPFRNVHGDYVNENGDVIFVGMEPIHDLAEPKGTEVTLKTNAGNVKALWYEAAWPDYKHIEGSYDDDMYTKPEGIIKVYSMKWELNGIRYYLSTNKGVELTMEEAVKIAESFMAQQ